MTASAWWSVPVGPGSMLGEMALIADARRLTSAAAEGDAEVLRLSRSMFRRILEEYPETAQALHAQITEDLQAMIRRIEELGPRFELPDSVEDRNARSPARGPKAGPSRAPRAGSRCRQGCATRFGDDQTWSRRRPRSDTSQSCAR